jgi:hypothetical protein
VPVDQRGAEVEGGGSSAAGAPPRLVLPPMTRAAEPPSPTPPVTGGPPVETPEPYAVEGSTADSQTPPASAAPPSPPTIASNSAPPTGPAGATATTEEETGATTTALTDAAGELPVANDAAEEPSAASTELGTYLDGENLLVRFDPAEEAWYLMQSPSPLRAGEKLVALPAFYPKLNLTCGLVLKLGGGSMISLGVDPGDASVPAIDLAYGRVVIFNTTDEANRLRLTLGGETAVAQLEPSATLAVSVEPEYVPGRDPRQASSPVDVAIYVRNADVRWEDASGSVSVSAPSHWSVVDGVASAVSSDVAFPDWIDQEPVEPPSEKKYGAPQVRLRLTTTRPVEDQLLEIYQGSRQREVKSLVARSSVHVGQFVPFVEALRDSEQRPTWESQIETLRSAMALSPESAAKVWETLVEQRGEPAAHDLYEMLCGYSREQIGTTSEEIQAGPIARLIDWMEDDNLDHRVLAVQDMWEITGERHLRNPAGSQAERARGVRVWRQRLKRGEIHSL